MKATARQSGRDMATVLKELTVERSHRRARGAADRLTCEPNDMDEASIPKIISVDDHVDDHVVEPAHVWVPPGVR